MKLLGLLKLVFTGQPETNLIHLNQALDGHFSEGVADLLVEDDHLLVRDVTLPKMPKSSLLSALALNIDSHAPFKKQTVAFGFKVLMQDKQQIKVRQFLIQKDKLQQWQSQLSDLGVKVQRFLVASTPDTVLLDNTAEILRPYKRWQKANLGLLAAAIVLLCLLGWQKVGNLNEQFDLAQQNLGELRQEIATLRDGLDAQSDRSSGLSIIAQRQEENIRILERMDALTRVLPDDAWVSLITYEDRELTLLGNTASAPTDLIPVIASSSEFDTPILISGFALDDGSGEHRFELEVPFANAGE